MTPTIATAPNDMLGNKRTGGVPSVSVSGMAYISSIIYCHPPLNSSAGCLLLQVIMTHKWHSTLVHWGNNNPGGLNDKSHPPENVQSTILTKSFIINIALGLIRHKKLSN